MQAKHGDAEEDVEGSSPPKRLKPTKPIGKFELYTQAVRHLVKESIFAEVSSEWQREGRTPATPAEWKEFGKEVNRRVTKTVAANWRELNEASRAPYERQAQQEMRAYMQAMAA